MVRWLLTLTLAFIVLAATDASAASSLPGNRFPVTEREMFLTGTSANQDGDATGRQLSETSAGPTGQQIYLAPGIDLLGVVNTPASYSWYSTMPWDKSLEVVDDAMARLYFTANGQAITGISTVNLYDVAPDGQSDLIDSYERQFVTALNPTPIDFPLSTTGAIVEQGHILRLEVFTQTTNAAVILEFGGDTPSSLSGLATRWLDTDADGMPDSDELAANRNPLNPNDPTGDGSDGDRDGLSDVVEASIGTNPANNDTDGDGYGDGLELHAGSDPLDATSVPYDVNQNGLPDNFETTYFSNTTFNNGTTVNPTSGPCTPGNNCVDPFADPDGDGCNNLCEAAHGTDPNNADTDSDGLPDGEEVGRSDPNAFTAMVGGVSGVPEPVATAAFFAVGSTICLVALLRRP